MNETLKISLLVDSTKATTNISSTAKQLKSLSTGSTEATAAIHSVSSSIKGLSRISLANVIGQFTNFGKGIKDALKATEQLSGVKIGEEFRDSIELTKSAFDYLKKGEMSLKNVAKEIGNTWKNTFGSIAKIIKGFLVDLLKLVAIATAVSAALASLAIKVAKTGDDIKDESQKLYLSATAYQEWGYVLKQNGVEISTLKMGMRTFAKEVANGDAKLAKYGITAKNVDEAFEQAVFTIQNMATETEKVAALTDLFGSRATDLMPVLNMTNEATKSLMETYRAIGGTMSNELVDASDKLTDSITELKSAWQGFRNAMAEKIIPIVTNAVQKLTLLLAKATILVKALTGTLGKDTYGSDVTENIKDNLGESVETAKELKKTIAGFDELNVLQSNTTDTTTTDETSYDSIASSFEGMADITDKIDAFKQKVMDNIDKIRNYASAAIAVIGSLIAIKMFSGLGNVISKIALWVANLNPIAIAIGTIVVGIGFIVSGIVEWAKVGEMTNEVMKKLLIGIGLITAGLFIIIGWPALIAGAVAAAVVVIIRYWDEIKAFFVNLWDGIKKVFNTGIEWVKNAFSKMGEAIKNVFKGIVNGVIWYIESLINGVIKSINLFLKGINGIIKGVGKVVGKEWGGITLISEVKLPRLANGGVIDQPTVAMLGEYGGAKSNPEIAAPQSVLQEIINTSNEDLAETFISIGRQIITSIENQNMEVKIGDDVIARSAHRGNQAYKNRTGSPLWTY